MSSAPICDGQGAADAQIIDGNCFLQTGLPESLPKPPARDHAVDKQFAVEHGLKSRPGQRGKDQLPRYSGQRGKDKIEQMSYMRLWPPDR